MTKNSTRKGLALGAIASLLFSGFSGAAANAVGVESLVQLAPTTGTEYAVIAGGSFKLTAENSSNANTGNLKFIVTDQSGQITSGLDTQGRSIGFAAASTVSYSTSGRVLSLFSSSNVAISAGATFKLSADIRLDNAGSPGTTVATASGVIFTATTSGDAKVVAFAQPTAVGTSNLAQDTTSAAVTLTVLSEPRNATSNTFVVDTGTRNVAKVLQLVSPDDATRTVTVRAWVDQNDDGVIDSFENVSPLRTITFVKASELSVSSAMAVVPGDENLAASVKTVPVLNGQQQLTNNSNFLNVAFTRQDGSNTLYAPNAAGWNDTTKEFSATISLTIGTSVGSNTTTSPSANTAWSGITDPATGAGATGTVASGSKTVTMTLANHGLRVGDQVTFDDVTLNLLDGAVVRVTSVLAADKFTVGSATASNTAISSETAADYSVTTYSGNQGIVDRAFAGTYTAQAYVNGVLAGAKVTAQAVAATSADVLFSTVGSASVQGTTSGTAAAVKTGTLTVPVTISVLDADEAAVTAGRPVVVTFTQTGVTGARVNDKTGSQTLTTDANGQVALTVTSPTGAVNSTVAITAIAENGPSETFTLTWANQTFSLVDLADTDATVNSVRAIAAGGSYTLDLAVMDAWYAVASSADYRLVVTGSGVVEGVKTLVDGKASVTISDNGFQTQILTTISIQKLTSGVWGPYAGTEITTNVNKDTNSVVLAADGASLYASVAADLSSPVAAKAIAAQDRRLTTAAQAKYSDSAVVTGKIQNAASSVGVNGAEVTITGPSSILFSNGSVDKIGSLTVLANGSGEFSVRLFSNTAQKDTVITVTSLGKSSTTKVTFTGTTTGGVGTTLVITAPDTVAPASTLQIKAKLTDSFGNAVASAPVKVTYTGPGIAFGALPTAVDAFGELSFSVLLGGGDTGNIVVTVSYDQNGDGDYVDAKDLNTSKTITVAAAAPAAPVADQKLTVGTFKGYVAIYTKGYTGSKLSAKVAGKWLVQDNLSSFTRTVRLTGAGFTIKVDLYIDGKFVRSETVVTK